MKTHSRFQAQIKRTTAVLTMCLALSACSSSSDGGDATIPAEALDIFAEPLMSQGCLDASGLMNSLRSLPQAAKMRRHSENFDLESLEEGQALRNNFIALAAFANFTYEETDASQSAHRFPQVVQNGCTSVDLIDSTGLAKSYAITPTENPASLKLMREDGSSITYTLVSPRELQIDESSVVIDPCPNYSKARATVKTQLIWGNASEISARPVPMSRGYLRALSTALIELPDGLKGLATFDSEDAITPPANELVGLKASAVDPQIHQCPYKANPPSGEESPPIHEG